MSQQKKINRRKFVKSAAQGVAATATLASCTTLDKIAKPEREPNEYVGSWQVDESEKFDFIVVGSGAGGGPLAAGLARAKFKVLLLEAGSNKENTNTNTPLFHAKASEDKLLNWSYFVDRYGADSKYKAYEKLNSKYQTIEQLKKYNILQQEGVYYPRASGLGGCTQLNALIALYPDISDWQKLSDNLDRETNDKRFHPARMRAVFDSMLKSKNRNAWLELSQANPETLMQERFLIKMAIASFGIDGGKASTEFLKIFEKFEITPENILNKQFHLIDKISDAGIADLRKKLVKTINTLINPNETLYTSLSQSKRNAVFNMPYTASGGIRNSVRNYIIETEASFSNYLFIKSESLCTKIIFDQNRRASEKPKAIGIEFIEGAHAYKADVLNQNSSSSYVRKKAFAKEVIVSGGAFNSPQLLMLSGVGPANELPSNIQLIKNLPGVGKNLQDRYEVTVVSELTEPMSMLKDCTFAKNNEFDKDPCWKDYVGNKTNHLYGTNGVALSLIRRSSDSQPTPDLCVFGLPGFFKGYEPGYAKKTTPNDMDPKSYFTWAILKGHTKNHAGEVKLRSDDAKDTPIINFKYFHDDKNGLKEDLGAVLSGLKIARTLNENIGQTYLKKEVYPGADVKSDSDLQSWIMKEAWGHHASCTNKMGHHTDPMAVVDRDFKVHGIEGLRVVDASVFPDIPGLFIMLPTLIMSEKAKDLILDEWLQRV